MEYIYRWIRGYIIISISGINKERFLNLCNNHKMKIWNICHQRDNSITLYIAVENIGKILDLRHKTYCKIKILKKYGLHFIFKKYKKRYLFIPGICICMLIVWIMSIYVWNIAVDGNKKITEDRIVKALKTENVSFGMRCKDVNGSKIELYLRKKFTDITWVSVELKGTRLIIHIKENNDREYHQNNTAPCDIVAEKPAYIESIVTRRGTPLIKTGEDVKKGDILVSGIVNIYGDSGELLSQDYVSADASVYGKVVYPYRDEMSMKYNEKQYSGRKRIAFTFKIGNHNLNLTGFPFEYEKYDIIADYSQLYLFTNYYLPVYRIKYNYREYEEVEKEYTDDEISELMKSRLAYFLGKLEEKGVQNIKNNVTIEIAGEKCISKGNIIAVEEIGKRQIINSSQQMEGNNDNERD